jgi:hypothetical protein
MLFFVIYAEAIGILENFPPSFGLASILRRSLAMFFRVAARLLGVRNWCHLEESVVKQHQSGNHGKHCVAQTA